MARVWLRSRSNSSWQSTARVAEQAHLHSGPLRQQLAKPLDCRVDDQRTGRSRDRLRLDTRFMFQLALVQSVTIQYHILTTCYIFSDLFILYLV